MVLVPICQSGLLYNLVIPHHTKQPHISAEQQLSIEVSVHLNGNQLFIQVLQQPYRLHMVNCLITS